MGDYSIDGLIRYFQMAHKVMGWTSTENSYEHHAAEMLNKLREERDEIERLREALRLEQEELAACCIDRRETQRERDEARRIACHNEAQFNKMMFDNPRYIDPAAIAAQRGWDCFKEENGNGR